MRGREEEGELVNEVIKRKEQFKLTGSGVAQVLARKGAEAEKHFKA